MDVKDQIRLSVSKRKLEFRGLILSDSDRIIKKLEETPEFNQAQTIATYWSIADEVNTHKLIEKWYTQKKILLPAIESGRMVLKKYTGKHHLIKGPKYGIPEPTGEVFSDFEAIDLIIVPGTAFDKLNQRLGRGKGYYDRFLHRMNCYKIGICFPFQIFDRIPVEGHDIAMNRVIY